MGSRSGEKGDSKAVRAEERVSIEMGTGSVQDDAFHGEGDV